MCDECNGMSRKEVNERTDRWIKLYGRAITFVEASGNSRSFGYTIGLTRVGHPEFMVRGLDFEDTCQMLNGFSDSVLAGGERFGQGHTARWNDGRLLFFSTVRRGIDSTAVGAYQRYGQRTRLLEISFISERGIGETPLDILSAWKN